MIKRTLQPDLFGAPVAKVAFDGALNVWPPEQWSVAPDWQPTVNHFFASQAGHGLTQFIVQRLAAGACIYPHEPLRALALTPLASVKVVIVGQDPYHGPGQAVGLAFSVAAGCKIPPSLRNIFKELQREAVAAHPDVPAPPMPSSGSLVRWAQQGVLLINTCLTVEQGAPASHANRGWEGLTDAIVQAVLARGGRPVVFMLWGAHAQKMALRVHNSSAKHTVLLANHPSPLSALRPPTPFIGCGHFGEANVALIRAQEVPVVW